MVHISSKQQNTYYVVLPFHCYVQSREEYMWGSMAKSPEIHMSEIQESDQIKLFVKSAIWDCI